MGFRNRLKQFFRRKKRNVDAHVDAHIGKISRKRTSRKKDYHKKPRKTIRISYGILYDFNQACKEHGISFSDAVEWLMQESLTRRFKQKLWKKIKARATQPETVRSPAQ